MADVVHGNGVRQTWEADPNGLRRPRRIRTEGAHAGGAPVEFDTGLYACDGPGNVTAIGAERYLYDRVSRLVSGTVQGNTSTQSYDYDPFGNIHRVTTNTWVRELASDPATNRLTSSGSAAVTYDAAGSLTSRGDHSLAWDPFAMLQGIEGPGLDRTYLYTADDERLTVIDDQLGGVETWQAGTRPNGCCWWEAEAVRIGPCRS